MVNLQDISEDKVERLNDQFISFFTLDKWNDSTEWQKYPTINNLTIHNNWIENIL